MTQSIGKDFCIRKVDMHQSKLNAITQPLMHGICLINDKIAQMTFLLKSMETKPYHHEDGRTSLVFSVRGPIPIQLGMTF